MSKTKGIKIVIGLVVGVLATTVIICAAVPQVRQSIKDMISKTASEKTPEEKENERKAFPPVFQATSAPRTRP